MHLATRESMAGLRVRRMLHAMLATIKQVPCSERRSNCMRRLHDCLRVSCMCMRKLLPQASIASRHWNARSRMDYGCCGLKLRSRLPLLRHSIHNSWLLLLLPCISVYSCSGSSEGYLMDLSSGSRAATPARDPCSRRITREESREKVVS